MTVPPRWAPDTQPAPPAPCPLGWLRSSGTPKATEPRRVRSSISSTRPTPWPLCLAKKAPTGMLSTGTPAPARVLCSATSSLPDDGSFTEKACSTRELSIAVVPQPAHSNAIQNRHLSQEEEELRSRNRRCFWGVFCWRRRYSSRWSETGLRFTGAARSLPVSQKA